MKNKYTKSAVENGRGFAWSEDHFERYFKEDLELIKTLSEESGYMRLKNTIETGKYWRIERAFEVEKELINKGILK